MEGKDFSSFIGELKQRTDIVDVIGSYVPVKQKGRSFWAACPFHHEKTPSFSISREGQFYKCFGCGVSGDVIKFVEEYESLSFMEAVEVLANRVGMKVPVFNGENRENVSDKKKRRERLVSLLKDSALFYNKALRSDYGEKARDYLQKRGFGKGEITKYALGFSPDYDSLPAYLTGKGYTAEEMKSAGVCGVNKNGKLYDFLAERMIVPIINSYREVVGFGGRILDKSGFAKYKNTQETEIFVKSKTLYNVNVVKALKQSGKLNDVVMVEGYMDVIGLGALGIDNVCASMGTSLTLEQARLLKRYVGEVYICYDGDSAGRNATVRGMDILAGEGLTVRVMSMPDGLDPDDFAKKYGAEEFLKLKESALPLTDYKIGLLRKKYDMNAPSLARREENRVAFSKEAGKILAEIPDKIERELYAGKITAETGLSADFLVSVAGKTQPLPEEPSFLPVKLNRQQKALAFIGACCLASKTFVDKNFIPMGYGETEDKLFSYVAECFSNGQKPRSQEVFSRTGEADDFLSAVMDADTDKPEAQKFYEDCVKMLKRDETDRKINALKESMKSLPPEEQLPILAQINALVKERNTLS